MTPGKWGSYARAWPYKFYNENALFPLKSSSLVLGIGDKQSIL